MSKALGVPDLSTLIRDERTCKQFIGARPLLVVDEERLGKEGSCIIASVVGDRRAGIATATNLEDGLQLCQAWMRMTTREHLNDEAAQRPNVGFAGICCLTDDFRCHPEDRALE